MKKNQTDQIDQTDEIDEIDQSHQTNEMNQMNRSGRSGCDSEPTGKEPRSHSPWMDGTRRRRDASDAINESHARDEKCG